MVSTYLLAGLAGPLTMAASATHDVAKRPAVASKLRRILDAAGADRLSEPPGRRQGATRQGRRRGGGGAEGKRGGGAATAAGQRRRGGGGSGGLSCHLGSGGSGVGGVSSSGGGGGFSSGSLVSGALALRHLGGTTRARSALGLL